MIPQRMVNSLHSEPSPAMFPSAHTAWSTTFRCSLDSNPTNNGTAPARSKRGEKRDQEFIRVQSSLGLKFRV